MTVVRRASSEQDPLFQVASAAPNTYKQAGNSFSHAKSAQGFKMPSPHPGELVNKVKRRCQETKSGRSGQ